MTHKQIEKELSIFLKNMKKHIGCVSDENLRPRMRYKPNSTRGATTLIPTFKFLKEFKKLQKKLAKTR